METTPREVLEFLAKQFPKKGKKIDFTLEAPNF